MGTPPDPFRGFAQQLEVVLRGQPGDAPCVGDFRRIGRAIRLDLREHAAFTQYRVERLRLAVGVLKCVAESFAGIPKGEAYFVGGLKAFRTYLFQPMSRSLQGSKEIMVPTSVRPLCIYQVKRERFIGKWSGGCHLSI